MNITTQAMAETLVVGQSNQTIERGGILGLIETLNLIHSQDDVGVLGIIFATDGSTYQKPGTLVLLDNTGLRHGAISGGCLEPELEESARVVYATRSAITIDFDTRSDEDLIFGSGTGCRGRVHILLMPLPPGAPLAEALCGLIEAADDIEITLVIEGPEIGSGCASLCGRDWFWAEDGKTLQHPPTKSFGSIDRTVSLQILRPPRVLLLGAGPETPALYLFY